MSGEGHKVGRPTNFTVPQKAPVLARIGHRPRGAYSEGVGRGHGRGVRVTNKKIGGRGHGGGGFVSGKGESFIPFNRSNQVVIARGGGGASAKGGRGGGSRGGRGSKFGEAGG
jgi:hypothetical protein